MWGSGRGEPDPFRSAEWRQEEVDFAVEQNGAGKGGTLLWSGMAPVVLGLWLRPGTRGVRRLGARWGGLVFGAPGAWGRAVFGGPARLVHAGVQGAGMPRGRRCSVGWDSGTGRCSVDRHALGRTG